LDGLRHDEGVGMGEIDTPRCQFCGKPLPGEKPTADGVLFCNQRECIKSYESFLSRKASLQGSLWAPLFVIAVLLVLVPAYALYVLATQPGPVPGSSPGLAVVAIVVGLVLIVRLIMKHLQ
jgi:hypothetical protein